MTTEQLKLFVLLSEEKSLNRVGQLMNITASNVRYHINSLEEETKVKLINRDKGGVTFTEEGLILLEKAKNILNLYDDLINTFSDSSEIKLGVDSTFVPYFYSNLLDRFSEETGFKIALNGNSEYRNLYRALAHNEISAFYLFEEDGIPEGLKFAKVRDEEYYAVTKKGLFSKNKIRLKDLEGFQLFTDEKTSKKNKVLIQALEKQNINCQIAENVPQSIAIQQIYNGQGISIIQDMVKDYFSNRFDVKEIEEITVAGGIYYRFYSNAIAQFIDFLKANLN